MKTSKTFLVLVTALIFTALGFSQDLESQEPVVLSKVIVKEERFWESWINMRAVPTEWKGEQVISSVRVNGLGKNSPLYRAGLRNGMSIWKIQGVVASGNSLKALNEKIAANLTRTDRPPTKFKVEVYDHSSGRMFRTIEVPLEEMFALWKKPAPGSQIAGEQAKGAH